MAVTGKLSATLVARTTKPGAYGDGAGLWLRVRGKHHRSWVFRFTFGGRARAMGLGDTITVPLSQAREEAAECRRLVKAGIDPVEHRRAQREAARVEHQKPTFAQVAEKYIGAHEVAWRNARHRQQWRSTLATYAFPVIGDRQIDRIDTAAVMLVLDDVWTQKPETASRLRGRIEAILAYATARGWRSGPNPAAWRGHLDRLLPPRAKVRQVEHHAALPWREVPGFMAQLGPQTSMGARALAFAVLTAARSGEVRGCRWAEIDLEQRLWTVPAGRMKAHREHRQPLSEPALAILREMQPLATGPESLVFPSQKRDKPLSDMTLTAVLKRMKLPVTAHGFRSSFRDWGGESTAFPREAIELCLAHRVGNAVEQAYARGDLLERRRQIMNSWAKYCLQGGAGSGEIVPIRAAAEVA